MTNDANAPYHAHIYYELDELAGEPLQLDLSVLDTRGINQGIARFGRTDV